MSHTVTFPIDIGTKLYYIKNIGSRFSSDGISTKNKELVEVTVVEINKKKSHGKVNWGFICSNGARYTFNSFGKTIFFNKEDYKG